MELIEIATTPPTLQTAEGPILTDSQALTVRGISVQSDQSLRCTLALTTADKLTELLWKLPKPPSGESGARSEPEHNLGSHYPSVRPKKRVNLLRPIIFFCIALLS